MSIPLIILIAILAVFAAAAGLFLLSIHATNKQADKYDAVGTTLGWQKSKVPFLGRIVILYTKKGKPYETATRLMFKPKKLRDGTKNRWTVYTYHLKGKPTMTMAKRYKKRRCASH